MSTAIAEPEALRAPDAVDLSVWLAVAAGTLGAFMALLDVSIVNAALPVIQGEIGATQSEGTWVGTSYLVAEMVVMPLTAWFERMFGLRRVLLVGATIFTAFSIVCGLAADLTTLIFGRIGQGLAGGTMIPAGLTIMAKRLPLRLQSVGMAIFASAALLGPIIGPIFGGWLTENFSWNYAFFINVPICAGLIVLILAGVPPEKGEPGGFANADWLGVFGIMVGLGALTVLLEEGHREQWFQSALIWQLAALTIIGFAMVAVGQFTRETPVLKLRLLRDRGFFADVFLMLVTGAVLFSTLFTVPQFLAAIAGYNPLQSGKVLFFSGVVSLVAAVLYPALVARLDVRLIIGVAFLMTAAGSYVASQVTTDTVGSHFLPAMFLIGVGTTYSAIPLQQAAISAVDFDDAGQATSMFNVGRNLGGSFGLAALASFLDQRLEFHHWRLHGAIPANDPQVSQRLMELGAIAGSGPEAIEGAYRSLDSLVMREALVMAFGEIFVVLSLASLVTLPLVLLLKPIDLERAQGAAH